MPYDLIIKNGKIIDGSGIPGFRGDVAIRGGRIVGIGQVSGEARRVLDADGLVVAPGIIDNHTHYDARCPCRIKFSASIRRSRQRSGATAC